MTGGGGRTSQAVVATQRRSNLGLPTKKLWQLLKPGAPYTQQVCKMITRLCVALLSMQEAKLQLPFCKLPFFIAACSVLSRQVMPQGGKIDFRQLEHLFHCNPLTSCQEQLAAAFFRVGGSVTVTPKIYGLLAVTSKECNPAWCSVHFSIVCIDVHLNPNPLLYRPAFCHGIRYCATSSTSSSVS